MMRTFNDSCRPCAFFGPADMTRTRSVLMLTVAPRYFLAAPMTRTFNDSFRPCAFFGAAGRTRTCSDSLAMCTHLHCSTAVDGYSRAARRAARHIGDGQYGSTPRTGAEGGQHTQ